MPPRPRRWQGEALKAWLESGRRGIVEVVTGGGKTVFAQMAMAHLRRQTPDAIAVVLVPTLALVDQWYVSLREDLRVPESEIATFSGESRPADWAPVNLVTLNTARELMRRAPAEKTFLIVDECHRAASPENSLALRGEWLATLGLSATPQREYDLGFETVLVPHLGPIIYTYNYEAAADDGVIAPFDLVNVRVDLTHPEQLLYDRLSRRIATALRGRSGPSAAPNGHLDDRIRRLLQQRAAVSAAAAMRVPVAARIVESHKNERVVVFHERIPAAEAIHRILESRGISSTLYHSNLDPSTRRDNLRLYRKGAFPVLLTCRALDEGMNVPETRVAVIASSTASARQRIQRLGRVLRPAPGKSSATVYTIYASDLEHRRLIAESVDGRGARSVAWRSVRTPPRG